MPEGRHSKSSQRTSATHVWLVLWKANHAVEQNALSSISRLGLGFTDFAVLEVLLHKGSLPVNEIGKAVLLTSGSITTAIDRLQKRKLVRRSRQLEDQRVRLVELTEKGEQLIRCAFGQHELDMERVMSILTDTDRLELVTLLKKLGLFAETRLQKN